MKIGEKIKIVRKDKNLSQRILAEKIGVTGQFISLIEKGGSAPSIDTLQKIADALNVPINDLLETSETFESDFDIESFDKEVKQYITDLKNRIKKDANEKITNTLILQNIIIDRIADESAQRNLSVNSGKDFLYEFRKDDKGNMITGEELKSELIKIYEKKYLEEKLEDLRKDFSSIYHSSGESLEKYKEIYNDIPKNMIDRYILEKLYPEYLKESDEENNRKNEMIRKNDEATGLDQETLKKLKTMEIVKKD